MIAPGSWLEGLFRNPIIRFEDRNDRRVGHATIRGRSRAREHTESLMSYAAPWVAGDDRWTTPRSHGHLWVDGQRA